MKDLRKKVAVVALGISLGLLTSIAVGQMMYGNTFPFWNVTNDLTVGGNTTMTGNLTVGGTQTTTGVQTFTAAPVISALTASQAVFTTAGKALTSNAITGTGNVVMSASPTLTGTAGLASLTTSGTIVSTGLVTASAGVLGSITNDSATAGNVGELLTATIAVGSAVSGASTTNFANVTSVSLTAGDWDVSGTCDLIWTGITATVKSCGLGTTTNVQASQAGGSGIGTDPKTVTIGTFGTTLSGTDSITTPVTRVTLASTTTIYLVAGMTYSAGSFTQYGTIRARRMR